MAGQEVICIDSPARHAFSFTPSISLFVECESEAEFDMTFGKLSTDGAVLMPADNYGFSSKFGWIADRYGVSRQLNLKRGALVRLVFIGRPWQIRTADQRIKSPLLYRLS